MPPDPSSWHLDLDTLLLSPAAAAAYAIASRGRPLDRRRVALFGAGLVLLLLAFNTPLQTLALNYLLSAHLLQNVVVAEWAPALVVAGLTPAMAVSLARLPGMRVATHPLVALPLWLATYFVWHLPPLYDAALERPSTLLHLEHAMYFGTGFLMWWSIFHATPHRLPSALRALYLFAGFVLASPIGLLIALVPEPIYAFYEQAPRIWGLSALEDQQLGGVTMALEQAAVFFALFAVAFLDFLRSEG